jgi:hypothetical protein
MLPATMLPFPSAEPVAAVKVPEESWLLLLLLEGTGPGLRASGHSGRPQVPHCLLTPSTGRTCPLWLRGTWEQLSTGKRCWSSSSVQIGSCGSRLGCLSTNGMNKWPLVAIRGHCCWCSRFDPCCHHSLRGVMLGSTPVKVANATSAAAVAVFNRCWQQTACKRQLSCTA